MKIAVIGGSIAGCTIASILQKRFNVTVFERAKNLKSRGTGITMAPSLMKTLVDKKLIDENIVTYPASTRKFYCKDPAKPQIGRCIWNQDIDVLGLHWDELYSNLRKRVSNEIYKSGVTVENVLLKNNNASEIRLDNGDVLKFDLVIFSDGINSIGRPLLSPNSMLEYSGYVAWRGVVDFNKIKDKTPFINNIPYFCFDNGHLLAYAVNHGGKKQLNWVFYEHISLEQLDALGQTGYNDFSHSATEHMHKLAIKKLPANIAQLVIDTPTPFMQKISDVSVKCSANYGAVLLGDASIVLRPHVGNGASLAISDAITLGDRLLSNNNADTAIAQWQEDQLPERIQMYNLSKRMGENLVLNTPSWQEKNKLSMDSWWKEIIQDDRWYTNTNSQSPGR